MAVITQINRIGGNIADSFDAVEEKGGTLPATLNSDYLEDAIRSIPSGKPKYGWNVREAKKGDLITFDGVSSTHQYRILNMSGNIAEVVDIQNNARANFCQSSRVSNDYVNSLADDYCTNTEGSHYLAALTDEVKSALIEKTINIYKYETNDEVYNETTHASYADYSTKTFVQSITRKIYMLDVEDIENYFGGQFSATELYGVFYKETAPQQYGFWLRSPQTQSIGTDMEWLLHKNYLSAGAVNLGYRLCPAFQIDLSRVHYKFV